MKRVVIAAVLSLMMAVSFGAAAAENGSPSPELLQLERNVALKLAHARDEGYTDPSKLNKLAEAQRVDLEAEKALQAGEYQRAQTRFVESLRLLQNLDL